MSFALPEPGLIQPSQEDFGLQRRRILMYLENIWWERGRFWEPSRAGCSEGIRQVHWAMNDRPGPEAPHTPILDPGEERDSSTVTEERATPGQDTLLHERC